MLGVFAEFKTNLRRERQLEGIAKAKSNGFYRGRKPSVDPKDVQRMQDAGMKPTEITKQLKVSRSTVWRALRTAASAR